MKNKSFLGLLLFSCICLTAIAQETTKPVKAIPSAMHSRASDHQGVSPLLFQSDIFKQKGTEYEQRV